MKTTSIPRRRLAGQRLLATMSAVATLLYPPFRMDARLARLAKGTVPGCMEPS